MRPSYKLRVMDAKQIRELRTSLDMSQKTFGRMLGLSHENAGHPVSRWETGDARPRDSTVKLMKIADIVYSAYPRTSDLKLIRQILESQTS